MSQVAERPLSVPVVSAEWPWKAGREGSILSWLYALYRLTYNDQIWRGNTWGKGVFLVSHVPHPKGRGPSAPKFLGPYNACTRYEEQ